jgi:cytoskeletal protein RodZ
MESIGQKLTSARETLGFSVEQIARDTNIAKSYLIALEAEDFDSFPGETYLLGFLRNYSEYLGIDSDEMISLYKNMMIQEQPVPMEELFEKRKPVPVGLIIIILVVLGLAATGYFYIYPNYISADRTVREVRVEDAPEKAEKSREVVIRNTYDFSDEVVEKRFRTGDAISVSVDDEKFNLVIADIGNSVTFIHPEGELEMSDGEEVLLDLDGDESPDVRILLRSSDSENNSAVIHIDRFIQTSGRPAHEASGDSEHAETPQVAAVAASASFGEAGVESRVADSVVIRDAARPEAFTLNVIFRGYCLLRYFSDNSVREERYFHKGETFRLDAESEVRLWVSNAGALSAKVNGVDVNLGKSGEISTKSIKWLYNEDSSKYELQLIPVY